MLDSHTQGDKDTAQWNLVVEALDLHSKMIQQTSAWERLAN